MSVPTSRDYIIIIPAYNEEMSIGNSLDAISKAVEKTSHHLVRLIICLNGCTDGTRKVIDQWKDKLPITIISSAPGYLNAMNHLLGYARRYYPKSSLVKTDADTVIAPNALQLLLDQFERHPEIIVAGGHPLPSYSGALTRTQALLAHIFSVRSTYPLAQVAVADVSLYHQACLVDPQNGIDSRELRLKTFFHGRLWCARTSDSIANLSDSVIGDDVYLTVWLYQTYGPGAIRVIYNANTYSAPTHSFRRHWMVYKRIHEDKRRTESITEYKELQQLQQTTLDWKYIFTRVPAKGALLFIMYAAICSIEEFSFSRTLYKERYWQYKEKET